MKTYDTQEQAEQAVSNLKNLPIPGHCPVINGECISSCMCWIAARYCPGQGVNNRLYVVYPPYCSHPFISGEINVYINQ